MNGPPLPEWAPHEAVWIGFPSDPQLWLGDLKDAEREVAEFARAVHANGHGETVPFYYFNRVRVSPYK